MLRALGARIGPDEEDAIRKAREASGATTADAVVALELAPRALVERALAMAKSEGRGTDAFELSVTGAKMALREAREAAVALGRTAMAIVGE